MANDNVMELYKLMLLVARNRATFQLHSDMPLKKSEWMWYPSSRWWNGCWFCAFDL